MRNEIGTLFADLDALPSVRDDDGRLLGFALRTEDDHVAADAAYQALGGLQRTMVVDPVYVKAKARLDELKKIVAQPKNVLERARGMVRDAVIKYRADQDKKAAEAARASVQETGGDAAEEGNAVERALAHTKADRADCGLSSGRKLWYARVVDLGRLAAQVVAMDDELFALAKEIRGRRSALTAVTVEALVGVGERKRASGVKVLTSTELNRLADSHETKLTVEGVVVESEDTIASRR